MLTSDRGTGWRKASFSDDGNGCVEVFRTLTAVRDSKNADGPRIAVDARRLVRAVKDDRI
jgi:hypothetical protein